YSHFVWQRSCTLRANLRGLCHPLHRVVRGIITLLIVKGDYSSGHRAKRTERDKPIDEGVLPVDGCSQYYGDSQPVGAFGASRGAACEARGLSSTGVGLPMGIRRYSRTKRYANRAATTPIPRQPATSRKAANTMRNPTQPATNAKRCRVHRSGSPDVRRMRSMMPTRRPAPSRTVTSGYTPRAGPPP